MSKPRLQGKVVLITGATNGIGEEAARLFAENGAFVVAIDVQDELGNQVKTSIGLDRVSYRHCNVRDEKQVEEIIDVLFNNVGILGPLTGILELNINGGFEDTMATNVRVMAATMKHAAQAIVDRKTHGSISCTTSVAASLGGVGPLAYTTSKHALVGLVRVACVELGAHGIRVNYISPFRIVATPLSCRAFNLQPEQVEAYSYIAANLKGIVLKAKHVAEVAMFLASNKSTYISGHNLIVDGGFTVVNQQFSAM
ncbi:hypothetical protein I3843_Q057800 [Carya illinoinensis]|nr:hypothetical protein I3843_Q057800 [Carya illinoinensis]